MGASEFQRLIEREDDDIELKSGASAKKLRETMVAFTTVVPKKSYSMLLRLAR